MVVRSCWPSRRRVCSAGLISSIWDRGGCGISRLRFRCSRFKQRACAQTFLRCGRWMRVRGICGPAPTSFIGRECELDEVQAAVKAHRLVTLTGVGGVGKTRLALEVAARLVDEFLDGVWVFELAAVTDPAAVPDAVAAVLGITQQPGKTVTESVAAALEGRLRLLVFDNCEHVRDAAAGLVEAILAASATVRVLATSREGLALAQEQVWPVPSLDIGAGIDSAAVSLFVERAQGIAPSFALVDSDEAAAVVEIC